MAGATVDPRLLAPRAGRTPAELVAGDLGGGATLLRIEGGAPSWSELAALGASERDEVRRFLGHVAALTIGVGPEAPWLAPAFDLWTADPAEADRWEKGFDRAPLAAMAAALLVRGGEAARRDVWAGLVAESTTYSLLQAGPDFRQWLATRAPRSAAADTRPRVQVERQRRSWEIVLTRPDRHNALDARMRDELHAALDEARSRPDVSVVLRGEGPSFCSGGDLAEFGTAPGPVEAHAVRLGRSLALLVWELGARIVVGIHGSCLGAGIELPAFAGRVVAADDARVGLPELDLGLLPGAGGTVSIPRRAGSGVLLDLLLSGGTIDAGAALDAGLVDEVVPPDQLRARLHELAGGAT
ncbi:MAG TPA: enoyl-CoA hydratase/isomerase family protein [Acidimicrobiales bacterium]|nr:enoyl-CoA hydratase/isomerase family protein [Acidimicrobiales bacterium]